MALIRILDTPGELAEAVAGLVVETALRARRDRGRFVWGLSGGGTPALLYRRLAEAPYASLMPWDATWVFWGDERWVAPGHPDSNQRMARETLLDHVPLDEERILAIDADAAAGPESAAEDAARRLAAVFDGAPPRADLLLLGVGEDGHTASLFPGAGALSEQELLFTATWSAPGGACRITATLPLINASRRTVFLVSGAAKAEVVARAIDGSAPEPSVPASLVRPERGSLFWYLDREAAAGFSGAARAS